MVECGLLSGRFAMLCRECGCEQVPGQFCRQCGTRAAEPFPASYASTSASPAWRGYSERPASGFASLSRRRVQQHLQTLGVLWCTFGGVRVVTGILALTALHTLSDKGLFFSGDVASFVPHLFRGLAPVLAGSIAAMGLLDLVTGWALLSGKPWARILAIVVAIRSLIKPPFGTALGIYTLWVLAPAASAEEWQTMHQAGHVAAT